MISGKEAFRIMDQEGLSFGLIMLSLRDRGLTMNHLGFMEAARQSGNYSWSRLCSLYSEEAIFHDQGFMDRAERALYVVFSDDQAARSLYADYLDY